MDPDILQRAASRLATAITYVHPDGSLVEHVDDPAQSPDAYRSARHAEVTRAVIDLARATLPVSSRTSMSALGAQLLLWAATKLGGYDVTVVEKAGDR